MYPQYLSPPPRRSRSQSLQSSPIPGAVERTPQAVRQELGSYLKNFDFERFLKTFPYDSHVRGYFASFSPTRIYILMLDALTDVPPSEIHAPQYQSVMYARKELEDELQVLDSVLESMASTELDVQKIRDAVNWMRNDIKRRGLPRGSEVTSPTRGHATTPATSSSRLDGGRYVPPPQTPNRVHDTPEPLTWDRFQRQRSTPSSSTRYRKGGSSSRGLDSATMDYPVVVDLAVPQPDAYGRYHPRTEYQLAPQPYCERIELESHHGPPNGSSRASMLTPPRHDAANFGPGSSAHSRYYTWSQH